MDASPHFRGIPVVLEPLMVEQEFHLFDPDPWVAWEPKDYHALAVLGMGRWVTVPSTKVYHVLGRLVMHPAMWARIRAELPTFKRTP